MKKLTLFVLLFVSAISFANNVELNSQLEKTTETNQLELNSSDDATDDSSCLYTTTRVYSTTIKRKVISMIKGLEAYEEVTIIHSICTTCYYNNSGSIASSTTCVNFD